ncbi:MAG TPA: hypothetical protein VLM75_00520 [Spirochaetota bacterium]|nr:hypothetical protein [Spirochaetota bacterium]
MNRIVSGLYGLHLRYPYVRQAIWSLAGLVVAAGVVVVVSVSVKVSTLPVGWERSFFISPVGVDARNIQVASRGRFIAAVFEGMDKKAHRIYAALSFDGGKSFFDPIPIADVAIGMDHYPYIAVSGSGQVAVVWQNILPEDAKIRVFYSVSTDMGATWASPSRVYLPSDTELLPMVFYDDRNTLHLFYHGQRLGAFTLFHAESPDGKTFNEPDVLARAGDLRGSFFPAVHLEGNHIFVVWQGKGDFHGVLADDLYFIRSENYGRSWSSARRITRSPANDAAPSIAFYHDTIYCVYQNNDDKNWAIKMLRGGDYGKTWTERPLDVTATNANCYSPRVLPGRIDELVIVWYDTRDVRPGIMSRKYMLADRAFSAENRLSPQNVPARKPAMVSSNARVVAVWEEADRVAAKHSDIYVDTPVLFSPTHPENAWSKDSTALVQWTPPTDESGIIGYAVIVNKVPDFIPAVQNLEGNVRTYRIPDLDDGISYFHIRAVDGAGNYSRTIHYPLQVSKNQLAGPLVVSPTHPESQVSASRAPRFRWTMGEKARLKGFLYSIARDTSVRPATFSGDFEAAFEGLEDGRYFFTLAAVDKTNTMGRVSVYEIIVNKADPLDLEAYERIAKGLDFGPGTGPPRPAVPRIEIVFPFDPKNPFDRGSFEARIVPRNIRPEFITGYSISAGGEPKRAPADINHTGDTVAFDDLEEGTYYISARAQYYRIEDGKKTLFWTQPAGASFVISARRDLSPVMAYAEELQKRLYRRWVVVSVSLLGLALSLVTIGYGTRLGFWARLVGFRVKSLVRVRLQVR